MFADSRYYFDSDVKLQRRTNHFSADSGRVFRIFRILHRFCSIGSNLE